MQKKKTPSRLRALLMRAQRFAFFSAAIVTAGGLGTGGMVVLRAKKLHHRASDCNPLDGGAGEDCFLPFPSSFYTRPDPSTPTGLRVRLAGADLPVSTLGQPLDPRPYEQRDGFSAAGTLLVYFPQRINPSHLPNPDQPKESLKPESPIQLFEAGTGARVPVFAELDSNVSSVLRDKQALILHPFIRLKPKTRYIVLIQNLVAADGKSIRPLTGFKALRDEAPLTTAALQSERLRYESIFTFLGTHGIRRKDLQLAWDFTTGSDESTVGRMVHMRDQASAFGRSPAAEENPVSVATTVENPSEMPELFRKITGTFAAASFLKGGTGHRLALTSTGEPEIAGEARFPFTIHVPACAKEARGPLPVLIYGHGTFNSAENEMGTRFSRRTLNRLCMIEVGTDWIGRAKSDLPYFILRILPNWNNFPAITDRLQQAHINFATLARLLHSGAFDSLPALRFHGRSLIDSSKVYYFGISEGGCQGVTAMALSPDIERAALNVPCGFWSTFFWRSSDFHVARRALRLSYSEALDQQKLLSMSQLLWDYTDPANYGEHLLKNPLPGNRPKKILYQEGINDASVPNLTTRAMARTIGLKLLSPAVEPVEGIADGKGPLDSAYVQFDVGSRPRLGATNEPPSTSEVHEQIRRLDAVQEQLKLFFRDQGTVVNTCGAGPCFFPM